jgi:hypothetical protein
MTCSSPNFNEHEGEFDVRGAAEATAAARVRRERSRGGPAMPASPLPRPPPGGGRDGSSGNNKEIHMRKLGLYRHKGSPLQRDALTRIDKVEHAIIEITPSSS